MIINWDFVLRYCATAVVVFITFGAGAVLLRVVSGQWLAVANDVAFSGRSICSRPVNSEGVAVSSLGIVWAKRCTCALFFYTPEES